LSSQFADCDHNPKNYGHNFQVVIKISGFAIPIPRLGTKSQNCDHKSRIAINIPELRSQFEDGGRKPTVQRASRRN